MSTTDATIRALGSRLDRGDHLRTTCPFCSATHENSFDIRRLEDKPHILTFVCWRGTCGQRGWILDKAGTSLILQPVRKDEPHRVSDPIPEHSPLPPRMYNLLKEKYAITQCTLNVQGCQYEPAHETLCMPWLSERGHQRGWVEKRFRRPDGVTKSYHLLCDRLDNHRLSYPALPQSYSYLPRDVICVLTEDLLSAYRVTQDGENTLGVALLGSALTDTDACQLGGLFDKIMVHTDYDVWPDAAVKIMDKLRVYTCVRATTNEQDIKDMGTEELQLHLEHIVRCFE